MEWVAEMQYRLLMHTGRTIFNLVLFLTVMGMVFLFDNKKYYLFKSVIEKSTRTNLAEWDFVGLYSLLLIPVSILLSVIAEQVPRLYILVIVCPMTLYCVMKLTPLLQK